MIQYITTAELRDDPAGSGHYNAPRGSRRHKGMDWAIEPGATVLSPVEGTVGRIGHAYSDDLAWRIVDILDPGEYRHRIFYVTPLVEQGDYVEHGQPIGEAQDITRRYPDQGMMSHVHYEIIGPDGRHMNPERYHG